MVEKIVNIKVNDNIDQATKSVGSLKSELRKAQLEVATLSDKFGATSKEAIEAAKRAAELKDKIGDAKNLTDAFNPDAKFKALSASIGGVSSAFAAYQGAMGVIGVESKDLEKQLLRVQGAMAISQGLQGLGEARDSFRQLKAVALDAFKGIKSAIGSTGIGLLVVALGVIYTYWDDIKEAVSGVSAEQKKMLTTLTAKAKASKDELSTLNSQDETLKRQGKTELEILHIKREKTKEAINDQINLVKAAVSTQKIQEETAARNQTILKGIIQVIEYPITGILRMVDLIGKAVGKNFGLEDKFVNGLSSLLFDPNQVKADGQKMIKESNKVIKELINQRDGYSNQRDAILKKEGAKEVQNVKDNSEEVKQARITALDDELTAILDQEQRIKDSEARKSQAKIDALDEELTSILDFDERVKKNEEEALEHKRILRAQELELTQSTFGKIADLAGRNSKIGKAFALGQAIINTYQGITAELQTKAVTPYEIGLKIANVALVAATGFKAVQSIMATNPMSEGGGATRPSGMGGSGATAPSFNIVGQNSNNQLAQSIANKQSQPIEAYVVSGNISNAQSLDRNRVNTATFN